MKKSFLALCLLISVATQAQYTVQALLQHEFTKVQVDSILNSLQLPAGVLTTHYAVKTYKVTYNTFDADSIPTTATGLLAVPVGAPCEVPILSFQHNNVLKKSDVPSRYSNYSQWFIGLAAASIGDITLMPDGIGLGDGPGLHPYLHLQSEANSVIDMIRAVREIVDTTGAGANEQLFIAGVAEGAYASMAAHQYIQAYLDSSMHVTASAGIAGYYDLSGTTLQMILSDSAYVDPSYLPELILGYNKAYHFFANDSDIFAHPYDSIIPPLFNGNNRSYTIDAQLPAVAKYVLRQDVIDSLQYDSTYILRRLLKENDVFNWAPTSSVSLLYCNADEYVPFQNSIVAYMHFAENGSTLVDTLNVGATLDHAECGQFSVLAAVSIITGLTHQPIVSYVTVQNDSSATVPNGVATIGDSLGDPPYTYLWSNGDTTTTITGLAAGKYYVTITDMAHCTNVDSATIRLVVNTGVAEVTLGNINVYPNPTQGIVMIENNNTIEKIRQVEILDISGKAVNAIQTQQGTATKIDLGEVAKGVYFLNIYAESGKELHRKVMVL